MPGKAQRRKPTIRVGIADKSPLDVAISGWVIEPSRGKYILDQLRGRPEAPRIIIYTGREAGSRHAARADAADHEADRAQAARGLNTEERP